MLKSNKQSETRAAESARARKSRYVFGAAMAGVALSGLPGLVDKAHAGLITNADFTFEAASAPGQPLAPSSGTGSASVTASAGDTFGVFSADIGTGSAYGFHMSSTTYSDPTGNGSTKSLSTNVWSVGDYYLFDVPTTNIQNIQVSFDQIGSSSGPADFELLYSTDGTNFSSVGSYVILLNTVTSSGSTFWGAASSQAFYNHAFDLSAIPGLNNNPDASFELEDLSTAAISSSVVGTGGTDRVDNFVVSGSPVPEPATVTLLTAAAAGLLMRRKRPSAE